MLQKSAILKSGSGRPNTEVQVRSGPGGGPGAGDSLICWLEIEFLLPAILCKALLTSGGNKSHHVERFSDILMACLLLSMMNTCVNEKPKYFSSTCCKS